MGRLSRLLALALVQAALAQRLSHREDPVKASPFGGWHAPPFEDAMGNRTIQWGWWHAEDRGWIPLLEELYDAHFLQTVSPARVSSRRDSGGDTRIPKIIHQVWLGGEPLPQQFAAWRDSWVSLHPGWKHVLWTDAEVEEFPFVRRDLFDAAPNLGAKSDALRLEVIWRFGGLYIDTDFECLRSFADLHTALDFYAALSNVGALEISNGIFAARKRHPLVAKLIHEDASSLLPAGLAAKLDWVGMPTIASSGPGRFTRVVMRALLEARRERGASWLTSEGGAGSEGSADSEGSAGSEGASGAESYGRVVILPINYVFALPNSMVSADSSTRERARAAHVAQVCRVSSICLRTNTHTCAHTYTDAYTHAYT